MIRAKKLSYGVGDFRLRQLDLEVAAGQYFVLLGPPGSGKTIFLECLCGLKRASSGQVFIDDRDITTLEPRLRGIGYVPQDYALFGHLSVRENIAFGLRTRSIGQKEVARKVTETADMLGIRHLLKRGIAGLSGGEKQRTALARALTLEPKVLLLDEPVCALDECTRQEVCALLCRVHEQLGLTTIHVSHNLQEAFSVADRAAILDGGTLQQVGALGELLRRPGNEFVARFMRCENIFFGEIARKDADGMPEAVVDGISLCLPDSSGDLGDKVEFMIRPEDVLVVPLDRPNGDQRNHFSSRVEHWRDCGDYIRVELNGQFKLVAHMTHAAFTELKADNSSELGVILRPEKVHVLGA